MVLCEVFVGFGMIRWYISDRIVKILCNDRGVLPVI